MCGILGLVGAKESGLTPELVKSATSQLLKLSESRGKESSGIALLTGDTIKVYKCAIPASLLTRDKVYADIFTQPGGGKNAGGGDGYAVALIGHARLVTNGTMEIHENNQPVVKSGIVGVHNGIIVNDEALWNQFSDLKRESMVDTEILLALVRLFLKDNALPEAIRRAFQLIKGSASIALLFEDLNCLALATNTGSLYTLTGRDDRICLFASEVYILKTFTQRHQLRALLKNYTISQVEADKGLIIDYGDLKTTPFSLKETGMSPDRRMVATAHYRISDIVSSQDTALRTTTRSPEAVLNIKLAVTGYMDTAFQKTVTAVNSLRRCTRCILPETVPFIEFDEHGVCNYCRNYKKIGELGDSALEEFLAPYRSKSGETDCIVPFSGGRDSSYGLHYIKKVLKMNPVAYTYDWGMVTDLGRRNQARLCGKLGVEHIWVSADLKKKRENIHKNIRAWLKRPDPGMVPLFMAGDKQYFYFANRLREQTGVKLVILCDNPFEKTDFKSGFCGIKPEFTEKSVYALSILNKIKLASYYARQYLLNPAYINSSLQDTLGAFFSYYVIKHGYLSLYRYIRWDESRIESTLKSEYDWEVATDTRTTWRIGDGTAPFYNFIYYTIAGFTENDTFRSNQIREGVTIRERALELAQEENRFRYDSFKWYCDIVGIDMEDSVKKINSVPKLYSK